MEVSSVQIIIPLVVAAIAVYGSHVTRDRVSQVLKRLEIVERLEGFPADLKNKVRMERALDKLDRQIFHEAIYDTFRPALRVFWVALATLAGSIVLSIVYLDAFGVAEDFRAIREALLWGVRASIYGSAGVLLSAVLGAWVFSWIVGPTILRESFKHGPKWIDQPEADQPEADQPEDDEPEDDEPEDDEPEDDEPEDDEPEDDQPEDDQPETPEPEPTATAGSRIFWVAVAIAVLLSKPTSRHRSTSSPRSDHLNAPTVGVSVKATRQEESSPETTKRSTVPLKGRRGA